MLPIIEMLTNDEINDALARVVLARKGVTGKKADSILESAESRVTFKNVKMPDGKTYLFATVGLLQISATETPVPETNDG